MSGTTYTEEQVQAKVAEALAPVQAKLDELAKAQTAEEIAAKIAEATGPLEAKIAELESAADVTAAELTSIKAERDALVTEKAEAEEAQKAAEERETRKADRVAKVLEVAKYDDEELAKRSERWADMEEASFEILLEDLKAHATPPTADPAPKRQPLKAAEAPASPAGGGLSTDLTKALGFRRAGIKTTA